jgi:hypothetical protein
VLVVIEVGLVAACASIRRVLLQQRMLVCVCAVCSILTQGEAGCRLCYWGSMWQDFAGMVVGGSCVCPFKAGQASLLPATLCGLNPPAGLALLFLAYALSNPIFGAANQGSGDTPVLACCALGFACLLFAGRWVSMVPSVPRGRSLDERVVWHVSRRGQEGVWNMLSDCTGNPLSCRLIW